MNYITSPCLPLCTDSSSLGPFPSLPPSHLVYTSISLSVFPSFSFSLTYFSASMVQIQPVESLTSPKPQLSPSPCEMAGRLWSLSTLWQPGGRQRLRFGSSRWEDHRQTPQAESEVSHDHVGEFSRCPHKRFGTVPELNKQNLLVCYISNLPSGDKKSCFQFWDYTQEMISNIYKLLD